MTPTGNWQRKLLGGFAALFLLGGFIASSTDFLAIGSKEFASGTLLKVGFVLAISWLAAPQLERLGWQNLRGTMLVAVIIVVVLYAVRPRIGAIAGAILVAGALLATLTGWFRSLTKPPKR